MWRRSGGGYFPYHPITGPCAEAENRYPRREQGSVSLVQPLSPGSFHCGPLDLSPLLSLIPYVSFNYDKIYIT